MKLKEIYLKIDNPNFVVTEAHENMVISLFKAFFEDKENKDQDESGKFAQLEIDIQNFVINDNKLSPKLTGTDNKGEYYQYPWIKLWSDDDYKYLIERQKQTKNPYLKAKYSHILWLSPKKHLQFATAALIQYLKIIRKLNLVVWNDEPGNDSYLLKHNLSNAFYLAASTKNTSEIEKVKKLLLRITRKFRYNSDKTYINIGLIQLMISNPKIFKKEDFIDLDKYCLKYSKKETSLHSKIDILKVADKVSNKLGLRNTEYQESIASIYEELCHQREDGNNLAAISFCQDALKIYKKLKNPLKIKELEDKYKLLKQTMKLGEFSHKFDLTDTVNEITKIADDVLKRSTEEIIVFLMYSPLILPPYDILYEEAMKLKNEGSLIFVVGTSLFDEHGNTSAYYNDDEESIHFSIMQSYGYRIQMSSLIFIKEIVIRAIEKNKLSSASFLDLIRRKSWLGQDITIVYKQNEKKTYNWLNTIAPSINDFFSQLYFYFQNPLNIPNYVLAVDSLSLKIEGILRDMCDLRGATTFFQTRDSKGRNIIKEKDINALLKEETIKNLLSKDDLLLLQYVLVDKVGWNLRNRVAHTLIRSSDNYGLHHMLLLIQVILILAKSEYAPPIRDTEK